MPEIKIPPRVLPPDLATLPTVVAVPKYKIADGSPVPAMEGPAFDREGNFYVCRTAPNNTVIVKITPEGVMSDFCRFDSGMSIGIAVHRDGRFFVSDMLDRCIRILSPDGEVMRCIYPKAGGEALCPDCMVFDENGDLYFTDLRGTYFSPIGGVYRLRAETGYESPELYIGGLASPNGLHFSPDHSRMWVVESSANCLNCFELEPDRTVMYRQYTPIRTYRNMGKPNLDTCNLDAAGNIYIGVMFGGRAVVLNPDGIPVMNILAPDFEGGSLQYTPNLVLKANEKEGYLLASGTGGAYICSFPTLEVSQRLYSGM